MKTRPNIAPLWKATDHPILFLLCQLLVHFRLLGYGGHSYRTSQKQRFKINMHSMLLKISISFNRHQILLFAAFGHVFAMSTIFRASSLFFHCPFPVFVPSGVWHIMSNCIFFNANTKPTKHMQLKKCLASLIPGLHMIPHCNRRIKGMKLHHF